MVTGMPHVSCQPSPHLRCMTSCALMNGPGPPWVSLGLSGRLLPGVEPGVTARSRSTPSIVAGHLACSPPSTGPSCRVMAVEAFALGRVPASVVIKLAACRELVATREPTRSPERLISLRPGRLWAWSI